MLIGFFQMGGPMFLKHSFSNIRWSSVGHSHQPSLVDTFFRVYVHYLVIFLVISFVTFVSPVYFYFLWDCLFSSVFFNDFTCSTKRHHLRASHVSLSNSKNFQWKSWPGTSEKLTILDFSMLPLQWQAHVHRTLEFVTFGALLSASGALGLPRAKSGQIHFCFISQWNINDCVLILYKKRSMIFTFYRWA